MENSFQTSFIPKKPIVANTAAATSSNTTSISMVVSVFILVVMLAAAGGLYFYKNYSLVKEKEKLSSNLFQIRDSFDKDTIAELEMYDKRTATAKEVLSSHIVLSPLFEKINELTLSTIQFTKFDHKTTNNSFSVRMSGIARDYKSIALQADVFNTSKGNAFKDVIFSNLTKDKNNFVTFDVEFSVDPSLLSYTNNITNRKVEVGNTPLNSNTEVAAPVTDNTNTTPTSGITNNQAVPVTSNQQ